MIEVSSADAIASIISLKAEVEESLGSAIKITLLGAAEAHLLAADLAAAQIGVVVAPSRPFPGSWEERRMYARCPAFASISRQLTSRN